MASNPIHVHNGVAMPAEAHRALHAAERRIARGARETSYVQCPICGEMVLAHTLYEHGCD